MVPDEIDALLAAPDRTTWLGRRDHALLLAVQAGLRLAELTGLRQRDLQVDSGPHVRCHGKGRRDRSTPLTRPTADPGSWQRSCPRSPSPDADTIGRSVARGSGATAHRAPHRPSRGTHQTNATLGYTLAVPRYVWDVAIGTAVVGMFISWAATCAQVARISARVGNRHGHPHPDVLATLDGLYIDIRRTDLDGTVRARVPEPRAVAAVGG